VGSGTRGAGLRPTASAVDEPPDPFDHPLHAEAPVGLKALALTF
jgi:hypothetical protein